jgi:1-deoxy-D-xylulose-5-phosphate synthase
MVEIAQEAAAMLAKNHGIQPAIINARWIKPMDTATLEFFARGCDVICTFEDHVLPNGYGCAVMEHLSAQRIVTPVVRIGWPDEFVEHGSVAVLRRKHGITAEAAVAKILPLLSAAGIAESTASAPSAA